MPQDHSSWTSAEVHWIWRNVNHNKLRHASFILIHWNATVILIAGEKLFWKRLWHRLRPPAVVVLDVHRGLRRQQQLGALHVAVDCCNMQRSPTSAPRRSEAPPAAAPRRLWAPGPPLPRTSTAAPFARRKATTAGRSVPAAACSAAQRTPATTKSKSRSRQRRSRRRWPRTAARSPEAAASAMLSSRRAEKWSRNEVPQFLRSLCFIFSTRPSLLLMEIILNKLETELIELLSSWCSCYRTWSATSNYFYNLLDLLSEVASSSIFSQ